MELTMIFPAAVEIIEVSPRDGLQNLGFSVSTEYKLHLIRRLIESNICTIEVTSFPQPKVIAELADGETVLATIKKEYRERVHCIVSALNETGALKAAEIGADAVTYVVSASEQHHLQLARQDLECSLQGFARFAEEKGKTRARFSISSAFVCPFHGIVNSDKVIRLIETGVTAGADEVSLADTTGTANPRQIHDLLQKVTRYFPGIQVNMHLHDTQGMGMANALMAFTMGFTRFETSIGGLGGNPFSPGAAGNIATEDVVNMFKAMGGATEIELDKVVGLAKEIKQDLSVNLSGRLVNS
jgi:hydroxymethylglutaryl-CoA lyase